jgi:hypothetical protein
MWSGLTTAVLWILLFVFLSGLQHSWDVAFLRDQFIQMVVAESALPWGITAMVCLRLLGPPAQPPHGSEVHVDDHGPGADSAVTGEHPPRESTTTG